MPRISNDCINRGSYRKTCVSRVSCTFRDFELTLGTAFFKLMGDSTLPEFTYKALGCGVQRNKTYLIYMGIFASFLVVWVLEESLEHSVTLWATLGAHEAF